VRLTVLPQILRNESQPAHELVCEKNLSDFSRFTQGNYGEFMSVRLSIEVVGQELLE